MRDLVTCTVDSDGVALVTFNNPPTLNALTKPMGLRFKQLLGDLAARDDVGCLVITGAGRAFSAGGQSDAAVAVVSRTPRCVCPLALCFAAPLILPAPPSPPPPGHAGDLDFLDDRAHRSTPEVNTNTMRAFYGLYIQPFTACAVPTIAAVNGHAIGAAFALALAADMRASFFPARRFALPDSAQHVLSTPTHAVHSAPTYCFLGPVGPRRCVPHASARTVELECV